MPGLTAGIPMSCGFILMHSISTTCTHKDTHKDTHRHTQAYAVDRQTCLSAMLEGPWLTAVKPALPPTKSVCLGEGEGKL